MIYAIIQRFRFITSAYAHPYYFSSGTNFIEMEFTQCLVFFAVNPSPKNTWPR